MTEEVEVADGVEHLVLHELVGIAQAVGVEDAVFVHHDRVVEAAAKAEHVHCSPDKEAAFKAIYAGAAPAQLRKCAEGKARVEADAGVVRSVGITGTPTLIAEGKIISGFRQAEIEEFLAGTKALANAGR